MEEVVTAVVWCSGRRAQFEQPRRPFPVLAASAACCSAPIVHQTSLGLAVVRVRVERQSARPGDPSANCCVPCGRWEGCDPLAQRLSHQTYQSKCRRRSNLLLHTTNYHHPTNDSPTSPARSTPETESRQWRSVEKHRIYNFLGVATRLPHTQSGRSSPSRLLTLTCTICFDNRHGLCEGSPAFVKTPGYPRYIKCRRRSQRSEKKMYVLIELA